MIDIDFLSKKYFYFDEPVEYILNNKNKLLIYPISLRSSEIFLSSMDILNIDKNSSPSVEIIQMSYLKFLYFLMTQNTIFISKLVNILILCLKLKKPEFIWENEKNPCLYDSETNIKINHKEFEDIRRIILYQNILNFDDDYINPELKKSIEELNRIKNKDIVLPNLERKMAIITARTGLSKKEQENMTYRSHCLLFEEVCEEVEFSTVRPIALLSNDNKIEHWIYKKNKNKFDKYITQIDSYTKSMGMDRSSIKSTYDNSKGNYYIQQAQSI